ncbi:hypothetical protein RF55_2007 [Lasius niger]|uniref:Uncharacterized protein n=1 Tax=Lasius niger TaxID=67767 RepID=A0A0J7L532_LASNI|nr:hypothetical protein RF55_2007 [Lasius niger]
MGPTRTRVFARVLFLLYCDFLLTKWTLWSRKGAVLAVKRLAGDNIQPLFASDRDGDGGGGGGGGADGGGCGGGGGWFPVWLAD